jgi:xanthine dehydrogenase iron-sulfur cluster and FAD-binding subunit A
MQGDLQAKIKGYEELITKANTMKVRAETQLEQLKVEREKIISDLRALGTSEAMLPTDIEELETVLVADVEKLDKWAAELREVLG